jgi:hypothetical protein
MTGIFAAVLAWVAFSVSVNASPLKTAPMPLCGPVDGAFNKIFDELRHQRVWRGAHENGLGDLEITVGRDGSWSMFFYSTDNAGDEHVCLVARGTASTEMFGRPV